MPRLSGWSQQNALGRWLRPLVARVSRWLRVLATHDFFPGFSARVRQVPYNPLGILLLAAVAALLCGFFLHSQGFILCGGVLSVIVLGVLWPWICVRGLTGSLARRGRRAWRCSPTFASTSSIWVASPARTRRCRLA